MIVENQDEVVAFLADPDSYHPPGRAVDRIDTHSAIVFLAGTRAYKLKRAVRYDYLDFSTGELRRAACEMEVALNRRTAPGLYLGVLPITRGPDGHLTFGGTGSLVEHVVNMVRFEQEALFDRLASRGALDVDLIEDLAEAVAAAHASAPRRFDYGGLAGMAWVVDGNAEGFREFGDVLDPELCQQGISLSRAALARHADLLEARRARGHVRECHGDLHLRNIVLFEGRPTLFDAVEFNERISCIDVVYDAAFLLMDLWRLEMRQQANDLFNRYMAATGELAALPLLPLFLSCRSAVRAKTSATAARLQPDRTRTEELRRAARGYLAASVELLRAPPPRLIAIGGLSGTGKSTLARTIAPSIGAVPGALIVRSDVVRKSLFGVPATVRLGERAYASEVTARVYTTLADRASTALRAGHSVVVDAVFADPRERAAIAKVARAQDVPFTGFWLQTPLDLSAARITGRRLDASDATVDVLAAQHSWDIGRMDWIPIDSSDDLDSLAREVAEVLGKPVTLQ